MDAAPSAEPTEVVGVSVVDCDEPHDFQVIDEVLHTATRDVGFPGTDALLEFGLGECLARFADAVGRPYAESILDVWAFVPTSDSWAIGDRSVQCVAVRYGGGQLDVDVIGAGL